MNAVKTPRAERKKRKLPPLNELKAAQEACRHAQEGNTKLARGIDLLREGLQTDRVCGSGFLNQAPDADDGGDAAGELRRKL